MLLSKVILRNRRVAKQFIPCFQFSNKLNNEKPKVDQKVSQRKNLFKRIPIDPKKVQDRKNQPSKKEKVKKYVINRKDDIKTFGGDIKRLDVKAVQSKTSGFVSRNSGRFARICKKIWHELKKIGRGFKQIYLDVKYSVH